MDFHPVILCQQGMLDSLDRLTASWGNTLRAGLFQNDIVPDPTNTIASFIEATFTGYTGLQLVQNWTTATQIGDHATSQADGIQWLMTGTALTNWIFGFFVVDTGGDLRWAQRFANAPLAMVNAGNRAIALPQFSLGSKYAA